MRLDNGDEDGGGDGECEMGIGPILYSLFILFEVCFFLENVVTATRCRVWYGRCPIGNSPRCRV